MTKQTVTVEVNLDQELFDRINNFIETAKRGGHTVDRQKVFDDAFNGVIVEVLKQVEASVEHYKKTGKILHGSHLSYTSKN